MLELDAVLEHIYDLEQRGFVAESLSMLAKLEEACPELLTEIKVEKGKLYFRNGQYKEALLEFILSYNLEPRAEVLNMVLAAYYEPNVPELKKRLSHNLEKLEEAPFPLWNKEVRMDIYPLYSEDGEVIYYDSLKKEFGIWRSLLRLSNCEKQLETCNNDTIMDGPSECEVINKATELIVEQSDGERPLKYNIVIYLYYSSVEFSLLLQCESFQNIKRFDQIIWVISEEGVKTLFNTDYRPPQFICSRHDKAILQIRNEAIDFCEEEYRKNEEECLRYYAQEHERIRERIQKKEPKVLVVTTRLTTVLQYHALNIQQALEHLGITCHLIRERADILLLRMTDVIRMITEEKPDLIILLDHFFFECHNDEIKIPCVTWVQDPIEFVLEKETPNRLRPCDFILNHFTTWKDFANVGYEKEKIIDAPIPANQRIYRPMELTDVQREYYGSDICFVCHASDVEEHLLKFLTRFPEQYRECIANVYMAYKEFCNENGDVFYSKEEFMAYVEGASKQIFGINFTSEVLKYVMNDMYLWYNQRVFRQLLVDWLLDAGYTNIKLWGNGWMNNERYAPYAMGPAENGEPLSKIYQSSKIVVGNNTATTAAARAWESMLSGAFYLANYIPPEEDYTDIRKILKPDEFVMFHGREDFLSKIEFYLTHDEERVKMAQKGREAALEKMTFEATMQRMLDELAKRI